MDFANFKLSRIAGYIICFIAAILMVSCSEPQDGDERYFVMYFGDGDNGDGDLHREIPAEGGSITLLSPDESAKIYNIQSCYLINQPLEWFVTNRVENPRLVCNLFFRTSYPFLYNSIKEEAFEGVIFYEFTDGYKESEKYIDQSICSIPLLYNVNKYHYGTADWLQIRIFKDKKIEVEAAPNDTGKDRYISFIYDLNGGPYSCYGSIEVKQSALR